MSASDYDHRALEQRRPGRESTDGSLDLIELVRLGTLAASSHNTQPWRFHLGARAIEIAPDISRRCPVVDPDNSHLYKSLGCAAENIVHAAAAQGHFARWRYDAARDRVVVDCEASSAAKPGELFRAITRRQCTRQPFDAQPLGATDRAALDRAGQGAGVRIAWVDDRARIDSVIDFVSRGNRTQLSDPAFRRELIGWLRFNPGAAMKAGDGLSGRASGNPQLPTWLGRFVIDLVLTPDEQAETDARNIRSSAGVAVFVSDGDEPGAWVATGAAFERFALQATALGIRTAFINQPIEVRALRPQFESWLGLAGAHAQLMVRYGRGPESPFSLRRPVESVIAQA
ncbi:MAG: nitroreductase family protein, partial [Rhodospirillaceae bacterium]|nr:nitroreductase family protein [Rhodospirillaceae bacterium]